MPENNKAVEFFTHIIKDEGFRKKFEKNPKQALKENGITWQDPRDLKVYEDTNDVKWIIVRQPTEVNQDILNSLPLSENEKKFIKDIAQSKNIREKFKKDPKGTLKSYQIEITQSKVNIIEDTDQVVNIVLPNRELKDALLEQISGGGAFTDWLLHKAPAIIQLPAFTLFGAITGIAIGIDKAIDASKK